MTEELAAGRDVGPYRLLFRLGRGGMGEVWAAERRGPSGSGFAKILALKLLPAPDLDRNTVVMFFDEARAAAALEHPAIVKTFDLGRDGELAYIAMELVRGPSLNALLQSLAENKRAPMSPAIVVHLGERVASALEHAHHRAELDGKRLRLVHRDVSPHNILLDTHGHVQLSDFGIARTAVQQHRTQTDVFRGKPGYMSPEQAMARPVDERSDLFALAIVMYECATLRRLFGRKTTRESIEALAKNDPHPIPELVPGFPDALWKLIQRALEKDRERRPTTAEFLASLRSFGDGAPASRELEALIAATFPDAAFDVDVRIEEARAGLTKNDWPSVPGGTDTWPDAAALPVPVPPPREVERERSDTARAFVEPMSERLDPARARSPWRAVAIALGLVVIAAGAGIGTMQLMSRDAAPRVVDPRSTATAATPLPRVKTRTSTVEAAADAPRQTPAIATPPPRPKKAATPVLAPTAIETPLTEAGAWNELAKLEAKDPVRAARLRTKFVEAKASGDPAQLERVIEEISR